MSAVVVACLAILAVLLWLPRRRAGSAAAAVLRPDTRPDDLHALRGDGSDRAQPPSLWRSDPVELYRARAARRRNGRAEAAALELLDAIAPALRAGLTPARSFEIAGSVLPGGLSLGAAREAGARSDAAAGAASAGRAGAAAAGRAGTGGDAEFGPGLGVVDSAAAFWGRWAQRSGSADLAFVASAWQLSETTGSPLAEAVERAAAQVRSGLSRQRRLAAAIAGPRATVTVLTALPLTGPLFGLACGLSPTGMYLSSGIAVGSLVAGATLILIGRWWCNRIIRGAGAT